MGYIGSMADSAIGFADGGLMTAIGGDIGKKLGTDIGNRLTEDNNTQMLIE